MAGRAADDSGPVEILEWEKLSGDADALDAWRRFAVARGNPFSSPEWLAACAGAASVQPIVLVARDSAGGHVGFLPVSPAATGSLRSLHLPGHRLADWYEPACAPAAEARFLEACADALEHLGCGVLALDRWGGEIEPFLGRGALRAQRARDDVLPFVELDDGWEGYLAGRSRNFRSQIGRRRRKLENGPGLEFRLADRAGFDEDWETFRRLHEMRWEERGEAGLLGGEGGAVHRAFAAAALERGWLRLWMMRVGGEDVGAWYGWRLGERYGYQLSGFDPAMSDAALGVVLLAHTIEQAAIEEARIYDLLWGDEPYKSRFATGRRTVPTLLLSRRWSLAGAAERGKVRLRSAGRRLPEPVRRLVKR